LNQDYYPIKPKEMAHMCKSLSSKSKATKLMSATQSARKNIKPKM